jgi:anti-anti-sigma factor
LTKSFGSCPNLLALLDTSWSINGVGVNVVSENPDTRPVSLEVVVDRHDGTGLLQVSGNLDGSRIERCEERVGGLLVEEGLANLILDLRGLRSIDSAGIELIRSLWERSRRNGLKLILVRASSAVRRPLELSGLDRLLPIVYELSRERRESQ